MQRPPVAYVLGCPHCGGEAAVRLNDAGHFWLGGLWRCPSCGAIVGRDDMREAPSKEKETR